MTETLQLLKAYIEAEGYEINKDVKWPDLPTGNHVLPKGFLDPVISYAVTKSDKANLTDCGYQMSPVKPEIGSVSIKEDSIRAEIRCGDEHYGVRPELSLSEKYKAEIDVKFDIIEKSLSAMAESLWIVNPVEALQELKEDMIITHKLYEERDRLLKEIPECHAHGAGCIPHAIEWVKSMKDKL